MIFETEQPKTHQENHQLDLKAVSVTKKSCVSYVIICVTLMAKKTNMENVVKKRS